MGFTHTIPEDRAGADLSSEAAHQMAAQFATAHGFAVDGMDLKESDSEKRKARRDYTLVWEARPGDARNVDETHYRVEIDLCGDAVCGMHQYWKTPETFQRSRDRQNVLSLSVSTLRLASTALGMVFGIWMLIGQIRRGAVPWRRALRLASIPDRHDGDRRPRSRSTSTCTAATTRRWHSELSPARRGWGWRCNWRWPMQCIRRAPPSSSRFSRRASRLFDRRVGCWHSMR